MAGVSQQTTVAATETPFLRASVNAVPGSDEVAAKVGNATPYDDALRGAIVGAPADPEAFA